MRENLIWDTVKNPRKENGDLGDLKCDRCRCQTGAYALIKGRYPVQTSMMIYTICKGCLLDAVKAIDKTILSDLDKT